MFNHELVYQVIGRSPLVRSSGIATAAILVTSSIFALPVNAQDTKPQLEEITVTAQKREERLIDVPISVRAIDEQTIRDARVNDLQDVVLLTPALEWGPSIGRESAILMIRGVGSNQFGDQTVVVYQNGFTMGDTRLINNSILFDLERIEILKGPQGTLYGRNALGGVINYISRQPSDELRGFVRASYGDFETQELAASISGPIVKDVFGVILTGGFKSHDGYWDNRFTGEKNVNGEENQFAHVGFHLTPNEAFSLSLEVTYDKTDDECGDCPNRPQSFDNTNLLELGQGLVNTNEYSRTVNQDIIGLFDRDVTQAVLTAEYDFDRSSLTSITGYGTMDLFLMADTDREPGSAGPFNAFDLGFDLDVFSQEIRLTSTGDSRFQWLLGGFWFTDELPFFVGILSPIIPRIQVVDDLHETTNYAGFFNGTYDVSDKVTLGFGIRFDHEKKEFVPSPGAEKRQKDADEWLPRVSISYHLTEDANLYAAVARGYKAGGFNPEFSPKLEYTSEFVWHYEIGTKGLFADRSAIYEVAAFYISRTDQHIQRVENSLPTRPIWTDNAGESTVWGVEAQIAAELSPGLNITGSFAYMDATFDTFFDDTGLAESYGLNPNYAGNKIPMAADFTVAVSAQYVFPLGGLEGWDFKARTDVRYTGERNYHASGGLPQDDFVVTNAYIGLQKEKFEIGIYADNLFDEGYHVFGTLGPGRLNLYTGAPRTYGVIGRLDF